jgi:Tfp pilus assembly protein PilF
MPFFFSAVSCVSGVKNRKVSTGTAVTQSADKDRGVSIAREIRNLTETGLVSSMLKALEIIVERDLSGSEFGRAMIAVNVAFITRFYPDAGRQLPQPDLPQTHIYARILRDAEKGVYTPPPPESSDFLEHILPFLALYSGDASNAASQRLLAALPDLQKAQSLKPSSALAPLFMGLVYERNGLLDEAAGAFAQAQDVSDECYPADLGLARVLNRSGKKQEAALVFQDLLQRFPDSLEVKRQWAIMLYEDGDWQQAESAVAGVLQRDSRNGEFILMRARILIELGQFSQAQAPLDLYAAINPNNRNYLFLRARVQAEGYRNRDSALGFLRAILRGSPADEEASIYTTRLLLESTRVSEQEEGRELFRRLIAAPQPALALLAVGAQDAIRRESWKEAQNYLVRLLEERRSSQDLAAACTVEHGLGNNARALSYARELYERDSASDEGAGVYISALIDTGRRDEASALIESRLANAASGVVKSRYYYLRSRLRSDEETAVGDLRSSLFEDPRSLGALTAMFEIYHRRRDERRAVYYLKQALTIAPDNPLLRRYEREYAAQLGIQ